MINYSYFGTSCYNVVLLFITQFIRVLLCRHTKCHPMKHCLFVRFVLMSELRSYVIVNHLSTAVVLSDDDVICDVIGDAN